MEKNTIFHVLIILAMILVVSVGCSDTDYKSKEIDGSFYVLIDLPNFQSEFTEGYPKDIKAEAYLGEKELNNNITLIWSSDIDGDIVEGKVMSTEYLSIGKHLITINVYDKYGKTAINTVEIIKVNRPIPRDVEQEAPSPRRVTDRVDGTVYVDNLDGTVTDTTTHRMWEQSDDGYSRNVYGAYQYCEDLDLAGHNDWRMPTISELKEIANIAPHKIEPIICEVFDNKNFAYWTQTKSSFKLSSYPDRNFYNSVKFDYYGHRNGLAGKVIRTADEYSQRYVRCVR